MTDAGYSQFLFLLCVIYGVWKLYFRRERAEEALGFLLLLSICWCASISWGYKGPILFSVPLLAGAWVLLAQFAETNKRSLAVYGGAGILATVLLASLFPYDDLDGRLHDRLDLSSVDPHLALIVSGQKTADKLNEFEALRRQFAGSYVSLPAFGWSYIFANVENPIGIDWPNRTEIGTYEPLLETQLNRGVEYAIIDKSARPPGDWVYVPLVGYVKSHWVLAYEGSWYWVYKNAQRNIAESPKPEQSSAFTK